MLSQTVAAYWVPSTHPVDLAKHAPSLLYSALPDLIQRRIPRIPSLRRTASRYRTPTAVHRPDDSDSDAATPPPSYRTSARTSLDGPATSDDDDDDDEQETFHSLPPSRPTTSGSATPTPTPASPLTPAGDGDSGVQWKYAKQGFALLALAAQEESLRAPEEAFTRQLYVDSLAYLLRGLPRDLAGSETAGLRAALPEALAPASLGGEGLGGAGSPRAGEDGEPIPRQRGERGEVSALHRAVARATLGLCLALAFVLPYLQLLLQQAYAYDRRHKVSDRALAQGLVTAERCRQQAVGLVGQVCAANEGQVGTAVRELGGWWVRGWSGGVCEGVGEGMLRCGYGNRDSKGGGGGRGARGERQAFTYR
ncbi:hypothetical protein LTR53_001992 [Teratosphaeriaceae sp. CCFEE 6253]|nr:hypothetical protein LTR53_001992 [Teratosphaeriaceae sp. CCFEE 6253]